uniref:MO25-like protein At5g47540 n=1 Tax=Nicotiana tabacum TaxID=4097 RepID=A0A1S4AX41_TOBAC
MAMMELSKSIRELKIILYGNGESEPLAEACAQLTQEFFRENTLRLIITCLPNLNLETRKDATQVVANLQRQQVQSRLIACDYLEANIDLMDILILGEATVDNMFKMWLLCPTLSNASASLLSANLACKFASAVARFVKLLLQNDMLFLFQAFSHET